jgi:hypothetical protein
MNCLRQAWKIPIFEIILQKRLFKLSLSKKSMNLNSRLPGLPIFLTINAFRWKKILSVDYAPFNTFKCVF